MDITLRGMAPLFQVFDMPRSVAFYRDLLGFQLIDSSALRGPDDFDWGWLRRDGIEIMLNTAYELDQRPEAPDADRVASHQDVSLYFGCKDLDAAFEYLRARNVDLEPPAVAPYGMRQLYFKDPDGYVLCFQWPAE